MTFSRPKLVAADPAVASSRPATPPPSDDRPLAAVPASPAPSKPASEALSVPTGELPAHPDAEAALLAALLEKPNDLLPLATPLVHVGDFTMPDLAATYQVMLQLHGAGLPADPVTVIGELQRKARFSRLEATALVEDLYGAAVSCEPERVLYYARLVRQYADARTLVLTLEREARLLRAKQAKPDEVARRLADAALTVQTPGQESGFKGMGEVVIETLDALAAREHSGGVGIPLGFPSIDARIGGGQPGELMVVGGVPGSGKTALALQIALNAAVDRDEPVGFVSAEMARVTLAERCLSNLGRVDTIALRTMRLSDEEHVRLGRAATLLRDKPLFIDDTASPDLRDVTARCRALKAKHPNMRIIVVDFLQLLTGGEGEDSNEALRLKLIAYAMKGLAKELGVLLIALAQLNDKEIEKRQDRRPQPNDLQGSSGFRQAADFIVLVYREKIYNPLVDKDTVELNFAKARGVATFVAMVEAQLKYMRLLDPAPTTHNAAGGSKEWWH